MDANIGCAHGLFDAVQGHAAQSFPPPGPVLKVSEGSTHRGDFGGQTELLEHLHRIGPQGQACSNLTQLVVLLEDGDPHACSLQGGGCGQPTNPATDYAHVPFVLVHQLPPSALAGADAPLAHRPMKPWPASPSRCAGTHGGTRPSCGGLLSILTELSVPV